MVGSPFPGLLEGKSQHACEQPGQKAKARLGSEGSSFLTLGRKHLLVPPASCTTVGPPWRSLLSAQRIYPPALKLFPNDSCGLLLRPML